MKMTSFFAALIILASSNFDLEPGELYSVVERKQADRLSRPWIDNIVSSGTINLAIPDENATGLVHTLNISGIPGGSVVDSIIIGFTVDHTWLEDVVINLEAPNGKIFNLVGNRGGGSIYGFQNVRVTSDNSKPAFPSGDYGGPLAGTYRADAKTQSTLDNDPANGGVITTPSVNTTVFNDLFSTQNGDWKIHVYDVFADDVGTLSDWSIKISYHASGDVPPSVTINQGASQTDPTSTSPILFTATFSEAVTGFATGDVTLSGTAGATTAVVSGGPTVYTVSVSGMTTSGTVIASINAGVAIDAGSNPNLASTSTDNTVTYDTPPTVTINQAAGQADPTSASPILFTVTFSEAVTGFATGDVTLSGTAGATTAIVSGSGAIYTVTVSGMTNSGTVIASINAGVAIDAGSNPNLASTSTDNTVTYNVPVDPQPTVTINQGSTQVDPTSTSPIIFDVVFSEPVTGFATGDVTLSGTADATTAIVSGSGATYTVTVSGMTNSGTVIASINAGVAIDAGSNPNLASTSTDNTVTYNTPATLTITQAAGQADPTSTSPIIFNVVFSEPVTGFATGDVTLSGTAGAATAVVSGSGATYTVTVSGMTNSGTVIASINAGVAIDAGNNPNLASTSTDNNVTYNVPVDPQPTVTINQGSTQVDPTSTSPIIFDVVFSEPVTGFATGDVTLSGTAGATTAIVSGGPTVYTVSVSGMTTNGTVIASINAGVAIDAGSNPNLASASTDNTVTYNATICNPSNTPEVDPVTDRAYCVGSIVPSIV